MICTISAATAVDPRLKSSKARFQSVKAKSTKSALHHIRRTEYLEAPVFILSCWRNWECHGRPLRVCLSLMIDEVIDSLKVFEIT